MIGAVFTLALGIAAVGAFTPLVPTAGYTYTVEAARAQAWPSCAFRFLSYSADSTTVDLWNGAGGNQHWQFVDTGSDDESFFLKTNYGTYLSYSGDCGNLIVSASSSAGTNQKFKFVVGDNTQFEYYIQAASRSQCDLQYMGFPEDCTTNSPDTVNLWTETPGANDRFRIYPISSTNPVVHKVGSSFVCPDPYAWNSGSEYKIQCTGGKLQLGHSADLDPATSQFTKLGECLSGTPAAWAAYDVADSRWAPENYLTTDNQYNYMFFSDTQEDDNGKHRLGWVRSSTGPNVNAYNVYSPTYLDLGMAPGGDIDSTIFTEPDNGKTYIVWKTDDNSVGSNVTHIWAQELSFADDTVTQIGTPVVLMNSTGLWWVDSSVPGGSLVEGPEVKKIGEYYYLFFAAGRYCTDSYTEGVARATNFFGPYEKMTSPLLSDGIVGMAASPSTGEQMQMVGPGHAAYLQAGDGSWRIVYHASVGDNCDRYAFIDKLVFGADGWPYVNMTSLVVPPETDDDQSGSDGGGSKSLSTGAVVAIAVVVPVVTIGIAVAVYFAFFAGKGSALMAGQGSSSTAMTARGANQA
jgi:GH43 family beta-xylosidase